MLALEHMHTISLTAFPFPSSVVDALRASFKVASISLDVIPPVPRPWTRCLTCSVAVLNYADVQDLLCALAWSTVSHRLRSLGTVLILP